jgi:hypothetical protein
MAFLLASACAFASFITSVLSNSSTNFENLSYRFGSKNDFDSLNYKSDIQLGLPWHFMYKSFFK